MAELKYISNNPENREAFEVNFDIPDDLTINEFKIMCIRMAHSIGYSHSSIEKTFGKESEVIDSDKRTEELLRTLGVESPHLTGSIEEN